MVPRIYVGRQTRCMSGAASAGRRRDIHRVQNLVRAGTKGAPMLDRPAAAFVV